MTERLYHGGVPGLNVGDILTGEHERKHHDGCPWCEARKDGTAVMDKPSKYPHVYVTTERDYARYHASLYGYGDLYRVEPITPLIESTEDSWPSWHTERVAVAGIVSRAVLLTWNERRRIYRQWGRWDTRKAAS